MKEGVCPPGRHRGGGPGGTSDGADGCADESNQDMEVGRAVVAVGAGGQLGSV